MLIDILYILLGVVIGGIAGFFIARTFMMRYFKKNPPINEKMIRALMQGMGRTPSQKQINQMMNQMKKMQ